MITCFFTNLILVDDLTGKYGEGEIFVCKCHTCEYEQEIRSEGVHLSDGGAVAVFSTEDDFSFPNSYRNQSSNEATYPGEPVLLNLLKFVFPITGRQTVSYAGQNN